MADDRFCAALRHVRAVAASPNAPARTDGELLRAFAAGDPAAFAALVRRHGPLVLRVCRRVLGHHDAEDAFQVTFLLLARRPHAVRKSESLAGWLHGVAYRTAANARRAADRRRRHEARAVRRPLPSAEIEADRREAAAILDEEVARLPAALRDAFVLCYLGDATRAEAARRLGVPEGTVWSRLAGARERLRHGLARRGVDLTVALAAAAAADAAAAAPPTSLVAATATVAAGAAPVVAVAEFLTEVTHAMLLSKLKAAFAVVLAAVVVVVGLQAAAQTKPVPEPVPPAARGLAADWSQSFAPDPANARPAPVGAGVKAKLWVDQGWLVVRRETAAGDLEWQVVLARADDARPPQAAVDQAAESIDIRYGPYFVRESAGSLRMLREPKTDRLPPWPQLPVDPARRSLGWAGVPARVTGWAEGDWYWVTAGRTDGRCDVWLRLTHKDLVGQGYGFLSATGVPLGRMDAGPNSVQDEGDLLVATRTRPAAVAAELNARAFRKGIGTTAAPALTIGRWVNAPGGLDLDRLRGKVVLLDFWGTWCGPCVAKLPRAEELHRKYKDRGLVVIGVHSASDSDKAGEFVKEKGYTFPVGVDAGAMAPRYAVQGWPTYFLIDKAGTLVWGLESDPPTDAQIEALLP